MTIICWHDNIVAILLIIIIFRHHGYTFHWELKVTETDTVHRLDRDCRWQQLAFHASLLMPLSALILLLIDTIIDAILIVTEFGGKKMQYCMKHVEN